MKRMLALLSTSPRALGVFALLAALAGPRVAFADGDAGVIVTGDPSVQPQLAARLEDWLREHRFAIVGAPLPSDAINTMIDCFVLDEGGMKCAAGVVDRRARAATVVFARADIALIGDGMRNITLTGYWFPKGGDATSRQRVCERCTEHLLKTETDALIAELATSQQRGTGRLHVVSSPPGATVLVDSDPVGVTPLDYDLVPGNHQVTLRLDGHEVETRSAAVREGETAVLDVPLAIASGPTGRRLRPLPVALAVGGLAALTTGIVWVAIDEDDSPTGPLQIRNTAPQGFVTAGVGLAAVAIGAWLWFRTPSSDSSSPVAAITPGGAYLGWSARF